MKNLAPPTEAATIRLNVFGGAYTQVPKSQRDHDWPELCDQLELMANVTARPGDPREQKKKLPAFTLGVLVDNERGEDKQGNSLGTAQAPYNLNANYLNHTALAIDVDTCQPETLEVIEASGLAAFVYATPTDPNRDGSRRVRIVVPISEPLAPEHVEHARLGLGELLGIGPGQGIETAKAIRQIMFTGRLHGTPPRDVWRFAGVPLDVPELLARPLTRAWRKALKHAPAPALERLAIADPDERTAALLEALAEHWEAPGEATGRRQVLRGFGGYLARRGWPDAQIAAVARALPTQRPEAARVALMVECARQARAEPDSAAGWSTLAAWNPEAAAAIESVAKDPREPDGFSGVWAPCLAKMFARAANDVPKAPGAEPFAPADSARDNDPSEDDWDSPEQPIDWYCEGLGIAPSERKVTLIAGDPGSGKGPLANYLAVCFALGLPAFNAYPCKQCNVGILDFEGKRLSMRRIKSHARGLKRKPSELKGRLFVRDVSPAEMADLGWVGEWIEKRSIGVLIVDSYTSAVAGLNVDANTMAFAGLARELAPLAPVTIAVAHARKPANGKKGERPSLGDVAGSFALASMAATAIAVWNPEEDEPNIARLGCMRAPDGAFEAVDIEWERDLIAPKDAPVWRARMKGSAGKQARAQAKAQTATEASDERLTRIADHVVASMRKNHAFPQTVHAITRDTGHHARDVGAVLAALERAELAHRLVRSGRAGGSDWILGDFEGVAFKAGEVVPAPARRRFGKFSVPT